MDRTAVGRSTTLGELTLAFLELERRLLESGGEWTEEVQAAQDALGDLEAHKVDGYATLARAFEARAEACRVERQTLSAPLADKEQSLRKAAVNLKARMLAHLEARKVTELPGKTWTAYLHRNSAPPNFEVVVPAEELPPAYQRISINHEAFLEAFAGKPVDQDVELSIADGEGTVRVIAKRARRGHHLRFK